MTESTPERKLCFLCFGMGAIGTYIGGSLALAGYPVSFIERPDAVEKAKANGLSLKLTDGVHSIDSVTVYSSLEEAIQKDSFDVALVAVKSFDTPAVVENIRPFKVNFPTLLCLKNGVENESAFEEVLGKEQVLGASICTAISKTGIGRITVEKLRGIGIESSGVTSKKIIQAFCEAGLRARGYSNRADLKWSKMLSNLLGNATSAILNWTPAQIFSDPQTYRVEVEQILETLTVMNKLGIKVVNLPGTPIKPLIWLIQNFPVSLSRPISYLAMGKGRGAKMPSFHIDLYNGQTRSEVNYLNGAVVRAGIKLGVKTPVNRVLTETLEDLAAGKMKKDDFANFPEKLAIRIQETK
jgi:2-dehydropantoate 2-reductase